ncbi:YbaK/EbsC family protein [Dermatophilaceae bacterium Soc4.6]
MSSATGILEWLPLLDHLDLVAAPVAAVAATLPSARVAVIDGAMADTAMFCTTYDVSPEASANCVVVAGRRGERTSYAAVMVLATTRADVNGVVRKTLDVRKCSFAPHDDAVSLTGMEFGGITPVGLPSDWPVLVDDAVAATDLVVVGSGRRTSKLLVSGADLAALRGARVLRLAQPA